MKAHVKQDYAGFFLSITSTGVVILFFSIVLYLPNYWLINDLWKLVLVIDVYLIVQLMRLYRKNGPIQAVLLFSLTYFLAPLPYLALDIPIVPYAVNVSIESFTKTSIVMLLFLLWLSFFSRIILFKLPPLKGSSLSNAPAIPKLNFGGLGVFYWGFAILIMATMFRGEAIVNVSGTDNYDIYIENLKSQGGALEYFLILIAVGHRITARRFERILYYACLIYYLFFCFTRGYRVQMLEMILLVSTLHFRHLMTTNNVIFAAVVGFFLLQAHGLIKHGASSLADIFTVMAGEEMRSNATEVFYTSNNVIVPLLEDVMPASERLLSAVLAFMAAFVPGSLLPEYWHSTLSSQNITGLPGGGGGFIAGHYFYWASHLGLIVGSAMVAALFVTYQRARTPRAFLLSALLLATSPRWIAYEPIANFYRMGLYFLVFYQIINFFSNLDSHSDKFRERKIT